MFFVTTLILLLVGLSAISAADATNDTSSTSQQDVVKEVNVEKVSDNTITDTSTKNIKKEEQATDLYVSDTDGSDDNSGTQTSPYKTIQKALDTTNADSTFNIHIAEGTYKGLGNTNLTVNGNYNINIIGEGNAVIDGEARYDIDTTEYHWGSSDIWSFYTNSSGNWAMNITKGDGIITLNNLTIKNCYSEGIDEGDSITKYPVATVDNYANLVVNNLKFINNHAGVGAGIRNNVNSTVEIKNTVFDGNKKSTSTGNYGAALYNAGIATMTNDTIINCYGRWGTVTNDGRLFVYNSSFNNNYAYDGASTYKAGSGIYSNTGESNFFETFSLDGLYVEIENCTFKDNQQADIVLGKSSAKINHNIFNHSSGIVSENNNQKVNITHNITNNEFIEIQTSNILSTLSGNSNNRWAIHLGSVFYNVLIENNTIDVPEIDTSYGIYARGTTIIKNNILNNYISLNHQDCQVINNTITTDNDYTITTSRKAIITNNTLIAKLLVGDDSIKGSATKTNNKPISTSYTITNDNYNEFFDENGVLREGKIENYNKILLSGNFFNKKFIIENIKCVITNNGTTTLYNGSITLQNKAMCDLSGINIINTDNDIEYALLINSTDNVISKMNIQMNSSNNITAIILSKENNIMNSANTLKLYGNKNITAVKTTADNNTIYVQTNIYPLNEYNNNTFISVLIESDENKIINNTNIKENYFTLTNNGTQYGTLAKNTNNTNITNRGYLTGKNIYGIKLDEFNENIYFYGNIYKANAEIAYGFYADGTNTIMNNIYTKEYHLGYTGGLNANYTRGIYVKNINNFNYTLTTSSTIGFNITGENTIGIELNNITNVTIFKIQPTSLTNGTFIIADNIKNMNITNSSTTSKDGIHINNSDNITITTSTIYTTNDYPIILTNTTNANITENYLVQTNGVSGNNAVKNDNENNIIEYNSPETFEITDDNYETYFTEGIFTCETPNAIITFGSDIHDKNLTFIKTIQIENLKNYTLYNSTLSFLNQSTGSKINNIKMNCTDDKTSLIYINVPVLNIENSTIYHESNKDNTKTIYADTLASTTIITNNTIITIGREIETEDNIPSNIVVYMAYADEWTRNNIRNNKIDITYNYSDKKGTTAAFWETQARNYYESNNITVKADNKAIAVHNYYYVAQSNITCTSNNQIHALEYIANSNNGIQVERNDFKLNGNNTIGIYIDSGYRRPVDVYNNTATIISNNTKFINIINNLSNLNIYQNNITVTSNNTEIIYNPYSIYMYDNTIRIDGNYNDSEKYIVNAGSGTVHDNYLKTRNSYGDNTIKESDNTNIYNNTPTIELTINEIKTTAGQTINITARITADNETITNINKGKVTFKVNGKTLKDANGKVIYAKVVNSVATIENYEVPSDWSKDGTTIQAVYSGSTDCEKLTSEKTDITIQKAVPTLTTEDITATTGGKITLKATITDNDKVINTGKIVFKINGKTVKDENGKVIYAKVVNNTVEFEYTLPESYKAGSYNITATFISADYDRLTDSKTLTVNT